MIAPTYSAAADPTENYVDSLIGAICDQACNENDPNADSDDDGINDVIEWWNPDGDGIIGEWEPVVNTTGQAIEDGNGFLVSTTDDPVDTDEDGDANFQDLDSDDDSLSDETEWEIIDTDSDMIPNYIDNDDDNDSCLTITELERGDDYLDSEDDCRSWTASSVKRSLIIPDDPEEETKEDPEEKQEKE